MVEDLAGLGKVAEVISNAVGKAIGSLMEPWQIRRVGYAKADAEVYAIEKKAEAEAKAALMLQGQPSLPKLGIDQSGDIKARAAQRVVTQEVHRQANLESIVAEAAQNAHSAEQQGAEPRSLDEDWIHAFLEYAQNVSNEELRHLWARILTTQAIEGAPTVSKATLDAIRLIETEQAQMFERAAKLYLAMGQIMDVDAEDIDIGYQSHMQQATALEDLGLLRRVRDVEPTLELHNGVLTFWRDVHPGEQEGDYLLWTDPSVRGQFIERLMAVACGNERDFHKLRDPIRVDRQILTTRGFELAAIIIPEFYSHMQRDHSEDVLALDEFGERAAQVRILNQWAAKLSAQGAAITLSIPIESDVLDAEETVGSSIGGRFNYLPTQIFNPDSGTWEAITR